MITFYKRKKQWKQQTKRRRNYINRKIDEETERVIKYNSLGLKNNSKSIDKKKASEVFSLNNNISLSEDYRNSTSRCVSVHSVQLKTIDISCMKT